jgi:exosortase
VTSTNRFRWTIGLLALVCALAWRTLAALFVLAYANPEHTHTLLVIPIVLAFLFLEQVSWKVSAPAGQSASAGFAIAAIALWFLAQRAPTADGLDLTLRVAALVFAAWAIVWCFYGASFFRAALFPMLFLLLLLPLPDEAIAKLTYALQAGSTFATYWLFKIFHVPVTRSGFMLSLPTFDIEVAKECSGIRSTVFLFLTALVLGQWYLRTGWRKWVLALAVFPIGIFRNGVRIFVISTLATYLDESWIEGSFHHQGGIVFFALGLALIGLLLWYLRRTEKGCPAAHPAGSALVGDTAGNPKN